MFMKDEPITKDLLETFAKNVEAKLANMEWWVIGVMALGSVAQIFIHRVIH